MSMKKERKGAILVVEDDDQIRTTLSEILHDEGYTVETAKNGEEAIHKSRDKFFNLAIIDIRLPDMEGVRLLTEMRETTPRMRKVIITGYPSMQNALEALNKGADAYIVKPLRIERLLTVVKDQLNKQQEEQKMTEKKVVEYIKMRARQMEEGK